MENGWVKSKWLSFCLLLLPALTAYSQQLGAYKEKYPEEKYVFLKKAEQAVIAFNKEGNLEVSETYEEEVFYLDDWAANMSERHIAFSDLNPLKSYEAYSLIPSGTKMVRKPVTKYKLIDKYASDNFHDDVKAYSFHFSSLGAGAVSYMKYETVTTDPFLYGTFTFAREVPIELSSYSVSYPAGVKIQWKIQNGEDLQIQVDSTVKKGLTTLQFTIKNLRKYPSENGAPDARYYRPRILVSIVSYEKNGQTQKVLGDAGDLAAWYCSLIKKVDNQLPAELKAVADSVNKAYTDEEDRVKAVFYWVQDHISYISIQDGMGGFIPANVQSCFQQRYGDCKAMSNLIKQMLDYMGIVSHYGLVGTRDLPYSYKDIPGAFIDNHMIAMYQSPGGQWRILDATGKYIPYGSIPAFIQEKEILIVKEDCSYVIYDVPVVPASENYSVDSFRIRFDGQVIMGKGLETYGGHDNININHRLLSLKKDQLEKALQNQFRRGTNKSTVTRTEVLNLNDRSKNLQIGYEVEVRDYAYFDDDEIIINPHFKRPLMSSRVDTVLHKTDKEYTHLGTFIYHLEMEIPEGYQAEFIPTSVKFEHPEFSVFLDYFTEGNIITHRSTVVMNTLIMKRTAFGRWNEMISALNKAYNETILLKKVL